MIKKPSRATARIKRHYRIRNKISGTANIPRLAVFRSNKHMYAQLIDDVNGTTLAAASTMESEIASKLEATSNVEAAKAVGEAIAKKANAKGITEAVFDRGGYIYHGRVQALAEAAREAGLQF
ncbi:MAG: 50S ribosomal protein L18 [Clostridia bacterium]|jgi:large subunit ribosomal protein L18|nr:50S ribosomal protein L18 [Clostridia bacterium]MCI2000618.1 50S ribosomal protein L18 [Clostridia bacterium]MCI2015309.1 50S ribosomal protein L18 [Clostridia bacterium]